MDEMRPESRAYDELDQLDRPASGLFIAGTRLLMLLFCLLVWLAVLLSLDAWLGFW